MLIEDDTEIAELTNEAELDRQIISVNATIWKDINHLQTFQIRVGDRMTIVGAAVTGRNEADDLVISLQPYSSYTIDPPVLRLLSITSVVATRNNRTANEARFLVLTRTTKYSGVR